VGEAHMPDGSLLGWTPGMLPFPGIAGMTWRLPPRTDLVLQLHMLPSNTPHTVQAAVGFHFAGPAEAPAPAHVLLLDADDQLNIPAGREELRRDRFNETAGRCRGPARLPARALPGNTYRSVGHAS